MVQNGILPQKGGHCALRVVGSCGVFTPDALRAAAQVAERCGGGRVTATSRGTLEIDRIPAQRLDEAVALAGALGLKLGGTGATVRAVAACKGTDCRRGVFDTHRLALQLDRAFFGAPVPKKFKIGVYGCPNSLGKARGQDVGILPAPGEAGRFLLFVGGMMGRRPRLGRLQHCRKAPWWRRWGGFWPSTAATAQRGSGWATCWRRGARPFLPSCKQS